MTLGLYIIVGIGGFLIGVGATLAFGYYSIKQQRKNAKVDGYRITMLAYQSPYHASKQAQTIINNDRTIIGDAWTPEVALGLAEIHLCAVNKLHDEVERDMNGAKTSSGILP